MKNGFIQHVLNLHHRMPYGIRSSYLPLIKVLRNARSLILPLRCFEGEEFSSGESLKIAYLGWDEKIENYWLTKLFRKYRQTGSVSYVPIMRIEKYLQRPIRNYDLAVIETNRFARPFISVKTGFLLPRWLEMQMDIEKSIHIMRQPEFQRLIRKYNLTCEIRNTEADFRFFFERMYIPYISLRHKDAAVLTDYNQFLNNIFRKKGSQLYFILKDGEPVAGSVDEIKKDYVRMSGIGILDGREDIRKMGVITALYYFQALEYNRRKIKSINLGGASPVLTDGLTSYKLSLGGHLFETVRKCEMYLQLIPLTRSDATRKVLSANPFISIHENLYKRNIFVDPEKEESKDYLLHLMKKTSMDHMKTTRIFCFNNDAMVKEWMRMAGHLEAEVMKY
jgi:hypothetical protein